MSKKANESLDYDGPAIVVDTTVPEPAPEPEPKPDPKPGEADYDWSTHYDTADLYTHTFGDGTVVAIRPFKTIYSKTWLYKVRDLMTIADVEFAALDRAACPTAQEVLRSLDDTDGDPLDELIQKWVDSGTEGLTPGK